jgi:Family of unknown function (DUF6523)
MTQPAGFGKPNAQKTQKSVSEGAKKRATAAQRYDEMKGQGVEYEVFLRPVGQTQWVPLGGGFMVPRSDQIDRAIYANEADLRQAALRRIPGLKKNRANLELEYGYRLKEYKDEPIQLAVRPVEPPPNPIQAVVANVGATLGGLFQKKTPEA